MKAVGMSEREAELSGYTKLVLSYLQAVPGSTNYEPLQLPEKELTVLLESEALALFLAKVWPR